MPTYTQAIPLRCFHIETRKDSSLMDGKHNRMHRELKLSLLWFFFPVKNSKTSSMFRVLTVLFSFFFFNGTCQLFINPSVPSPNQTSRIQTTRSVNHHFLLNHSIFLSRNMKKKPIIIQQPPLKCTWKCSSCLVEQ